MRNKNKLLGIGIVVALVLTAVLVMATVNTVNLISPADNTWTNTPYTNLNFTFNFTGNSSATCELKIDFNGNNLTSVRTASVTNYTNTDFTSNTSIPNGTHQWTITCGGIPSSTRTIKMDTITPTTSQDAPSGWQDNDVTITFTTDNDGLSPITTYACNGTFCTPTSRNSLIINTEGNNTIKYYSSDAAGNSETTKTINVLLDKTAPVVSLTEPNESAIFLNQNVFNFTFNVTDALSSTLNCSLKLNGALNETNSTVANNTQTTFSNILLPEGKNDWLVECTDIAGNTNVSQTRNLTVNVTPDKAVVFTPENLTNSASINVYGFVNRAGQNTNVTVYVQQEPNQNKNSQLTTYDAELLGNTTVFNLSVQNTTILYLKDIQGNAPPGFEVGKYLDFEQQEPYLLRHQIVALEYYPWGIQVNITPQLREPLTIGEDVYAYNQTQPTGWFNLSLNLLEGNNTIKVESRRLGTISPSSDSYFVFKDTTPPEINLTNITSYSVNNPQLIFQVTDNYAVNTSTITVNISNSTNTTTFNISDSDLDCSSLPQCSLQTSDLSEGYNNITIRIADVIGYYNTSTKQFLVDLTKPTIILNTPNASIIEDTTRNITLNFSASDNYATNLNCSLFVTDYLFGSYDYNITGINILSGESYQTELTNLNDTTYKWYVNCTDEAGAKNTSEIRYFGMSNTPDAVYVQNLSYIITPVQKLISANSLNLIGYIGKSATTINFTLTQDEKIPRTTQYLSNESAYRYIPYLNGEAKNQSVENQNIVAGDDYFYINKTYNDFYNHTDRYIDFAGSTDKKRVNALHYKIKNLTTIDNQYYSIVYLEQNITGNVSKGSYVYVYNQSKPNGWFNITLTNLFEGENNLTITGERMGLVGQSENFSIFYDNLPPAINISNIPANLTVNTTTLNFSLTDNYEIDLPSLILNITNSSTQIISVTNQTSYNTTGWTLGNNITCSGTQVYDCQLTTTFLDGTYNLSIKVYDTVGNVYIANITSLIVATNVLKPTTINDTGATTDNRSSLNVTWTNVSSQEYFSHYELAVGNSTYPNAGFNDTKNWFSVGQNISYDITNMTLIPGQMYYVHIRALNIYGAYSEIVVTDGIAIEDNSPPVYTPGSAVWIGTDTNNLWTNEISTLNASWNFTDNETGIDKFLYAIGTAKYPQVGWDNILSQKETNSFGFSETGLTLVENTSYYFSVKAKNTYQYGYGWSDWYSSEYIKQDLTTPTGGSISYQTGNYTAGSITLTYLTGDDSLSGYDHAELLKKQSTYNSTNGGCNAYSDYTSLNVSITKINTPTNYYYTGLQDGNCYKFALRVYDLAGNQIIYTSGNEDYNVTADSTVPSTVTISDEGTITGSRDLQFSWSQAVDPHTGILRYEYALGTSPGSEDIIYFTNSNLTRTVLFNNLPLVDEQTYYLTVKAYNRVGLVSTSYSDGILYLDTDTPAALSVYKIANDTNASDLYFDFDNDINTTILLTGENSLTCEWSYYDIDYTQPSQLTNYSWACTNTANDPTTRTGNYSCEIRTPNEGVYNVYVNCKDDAGNKQLSTQNTDITFTKENSAPQINITYPENNTIVNGVVIMNVSIWDISNYTARYELREVVSNDLIINETITDINNITINTTTYGGEYIFRVFATDEYNHSSNESTNFVVNNNAPTIRILLSDSYQKSNFNFSLATTLYYNLSYNITNASGIVVQNDSWNSTLLVATNTTIVTVNTTNLPEGTYTIAAKAKDNNSIVTATKSFTIDKTAPVYKGTLEVEPTGIIYENNTIKLYLNWKEITGLESIWVMHNANGSYVNYTATNTTPGQQIYENYTRYMVEIPTYLTSANQTISYTWYAKDLAGNINSTSANIVFITNRLVNITTTNLTDALYTVAYQENVYFEDEDSSHNSSDFNCSVQGLSMTTQIIGTTICRLTWNSPTPVGTTPINISVTDGINTTTKEFNLTVLPTAIHNATLNTSHTMTFEYWLNGTRRKMTTASSNINLTLLQSANYTFKLKVDKLEIISNNFNITSNIDVFFQLLNKDTIDNNETAIGTNRTYIPLEAYAFRLNVTPNNNDTHIIAFNYTNYPSVATNKFKIFKFKYDENTGAINYSDSTNLTTTLDTSSQLVYVTVSNFSAFILTEDTTVAAPPQFPGGGGGNGGGSAGTSSHGGSYYLAPATCNDNISNQGEIGVDCGGPCSPCETCHDQIQNQDETGVDCGGSCDKCVAPTCTDRVKNGDETGVDCGGSCKSCYPTPTCSDGIKNGYEIGVDCGGSCIPCPGCENGIKDAGEVGVDCGGVCDNECGPDVIEKPIEVKKTPAYMWAVILAVILMGGFSAMWIYKKGEKEVAQTTAQMATEQETVEELQDEERDVMSRYINNYLAQGFKETDVKNQLFMDGFKKNHIDLVMAAVLRDIKVEEIQNYILNYSNKGYSTEELREWILDQGIEESLIKEAEAKLNTKKDDLSNTDLSNINYDDILDKK